MMDPLKKPSIPEFLSFLKEKQLVQGKEFSLVEGVLMSCEENFKIELENLKKNFEEENIRIKERYKKIAAQKIEIYKERAHLLKERIDQLEDEKSETAEKIEDYKEKTQLLYQRIDELEKEKDEDEDKLRFYYEKFNDMNGRVSRLEEVMRKKDDSHEVQFNLAENCSGESRNEDPVVVDEASG